MSLRTTAVSLMLIIASVDARGEAPLEITVRDVSGKQITQFEAMLSRSGLFFRCNVRLPAMKASSLLSRFVGMSL